jgi:hypothetical protein
MHVFIHRDSKAWGPESVLPFCWPFKHSVVFLQVWPPGCRAPRRTAFVQRALFNVG